MESENNGRVDLPVERYEDLRAIERAYSELIKKVSIGSGVLVDHGETKLIFINAEGFLDKLPRYEYRGKDEALLVLQEQIKSLSKTISAFLRFQERVFYASIFTRIAYLFTGNIKTEESNG